MDCHSELRLWLWSDSSTTLLIQPSAAASLLVGLLL